jgi:transcription elongation factor Elf1
MILSDRFKTFICALSNSNGHHVVQEPICLDCNHLICSQCVDDESKKNIFCKFCEKNCQFKSSNESQSLNECIDEFFSYIGENFRIKIEQLKKSFENHVENIDLKIEFLKDEIEVRVDSLKTKIDRLHEELVENLMDYREKFLK